jgi:putative two-component system response regulator
MGASDFMAKPCDRAELLLRLRNHLRLRFASLDLAEQNLLLDGMMRHQAWSAEEARGQLVERLTRAAEFRDDETGAHARRVGHLAGRLGRELGLARPDLDLLQAAAPLHDVGKIAIPDAVLHKRGGLTDEERATMGAHTAIGAELLGGSRIPALELAAVIARTHHEWWDGSGAGSIRGEDIPVAGRIVAVADVYDALTSERPYKPAWPVAEAFAEISAGSGTRFDPAVVAALAAVLTDAGHDLTNGRHPEAGATYAHSC